MNHNEAVRQLNAETKKQRLAAIDEIVRAIQLGEIPRPVFGEDVNNHIHTTYSFSPYSPTMAVYMAYMSGLTTAGIMDHDSVSGAQEFIEAGERMHMATTVGCELRVSMTNTPLYGRRINNPDQDSVAYIAMHGIPHTQLNRIAAYLKPYLEKRMERNRSMVERINQLVEAPLRLDFDQDVLPISRYHEGGSVTERHILFALAQKLIQAFGQGTRLTEYLEGVLRIPLSGKVRQNLLDPENPYYAYDLLGALKSDMVSQFYVDADAECPDVQEAVDLAQEVGAISAYAYLGDVGSSVTGDKRTQKFEDDYLEELFEVLSQIGFKAVTYMPSRNTEQQLSRVRELCERYGLFQISGEDINSPRQAFICEALQNPVYHNLIDSTWALIGHEMSATDDLSTALFAPKTVDTYPDLNRRILVYKAIAKAKFI